MRFPYWLILSISLIAGLGLVMVGIFIGPSLLSGSRGNPPRTQDVRVTGTPVVWAGFPTQAAAPTRLPTSAPPSTAPPTPTETVRATPQPPCNAAEFVSDVTVPDGTTLRLGQEFDKTWRLKNAGSCTWDRHYDLVFIKGSPLTAQTVVPLSGPVYPGEVVDLTVQMAAPDKPGSYSGYWMLRDGDDQHFGIGKGAIGMFWIAVDVTESGAPEPGDPDGDAEKAAEAARQFLASQLGASPNEIVVLGVESARWFDTCLGIELGAAFDCRPVPEGIPGYRVQLKRGSNLYEARTSLSGSYVYWKTV
ncbi:MAG: NBR1-Ig-like domain-containing protein [Anaerolineales bacterium]|nr:NBR1-Ig-like domain-containing protein [Anaerolineales bacterium]